MIRPRIRSLPPALGTRGGEVIDLADRLGYTLDGWQRLAVNDLLATDENGGLAAYSAALIVARQCGKSLLASCTRRTSQPFRARPSCSRVTGLTAAN